MKKKLYTNEELDQREEAEYQAARQEHAYQTDVDNENWEALKDGIKGWAIWVGGAFAYYILVGPKGIWPNLISNLF